MQDQRYDQLVNSLKLFEIQAAAGECCHFQTFICWVWCGVRKVQSDAGNLNNKLLLSLLSATFRCKTSYDQLVNSLKLFEIQVLRQGNVVVTTYKLLDVGCCGLWCAHAKCVTKKTDQKSVRCKLLLKNAVVIIFE